MWKTAFKQTIFLKFFKGCLPQNSFSLLLTALSQIIGDLAINSLLTLQNLRMFGLTKFVYFIKYTVRVRIASLFKTFIQSFKTFVFVDLVKFQKIIFLSQLLESYSNHWKKMLIFRYNFYIYIHIFPFQIFRYFTLFIYLCICFFATPN